MDTIIGKMKIFILRSNFLFKFPSFIGSFIYINSFIAYSNMP
jgi:hypothetical protein